MTMMTRQEAKTLLTKALGHSKAEGCAISLSSSTDGNIRYARNTVTTSGLVTDTALVISSSYGKRLGTTTSNELDDASIKKAVRRSEELAKLAPENPEYMPVLGPQKYVDSNAYFDSTSEIDPAYRAKAAAASIGPSRKKKLIAAGFFDDSVGFQALLTSAGLFAYHRYTSADFSVTVRTEDGTGSGYAVRNQNDVSLLDTASASAVAIDKALESREPRAIEPGKYTVILEPAASSGLLRRMLFSLGARRADEGRSWLAKKGGGNKLGEKLVDERVTIYSDPSDPNVPVSPWSGDGRARGKTMWIDKGIVKNLSYSRYWAQQKEVEPVPGPSNSVMLGGDASLAQLVKDTERGVLVTRTWYIRSVDPQTLLNTGLTRDGTFFIKDGKIAFPVKNMRFNESPVIMLNNIEALGKPERVGRSMFPPMRIRDFTFTSLSDAV